MYRSTTGLIAILLLAGGVFAGSDYAAPTLNPPTDVEYVVCGSGQYNNGSYPWYGHTTNGCRFQTLLEASQLTQLVGKNIVSVGWRLASANTNNFTDVDILIGPTNLTQLGTAFAANYSAPPTLVYHADNLLVGNSGGGGINVWQDVNLSSVYPYSGGNLIVEISWQTYGGTTVTTYRSTPPTSGVPHILYVQNKTGTSGNTTNTHLDVRFGYEEPAGNPTIQNVIRDIEFPFSWEKVVVSATITPPAKEEIDIAQIKYSTDGGSNWTTDDFKDRNGDVYFFEIPAQTGGLTVDYKIYAHSSGGGEATSPTSSYTIPLDVSIYDIQHVDTTVTNSSPLEGKRVHVGAVITGRVTSRIFYCKQGAGDAWQGLTLYFTADQTFVPGDTVDVNGVVKEYNGLTEIDPLNRIELRGSGKSFDTLELTVPDARLEAYEGCLAIVKSIRVINTTDPTFLQNKAYDVEDEHGEQMKLYSTRYSNFVGAPVPSGYFDLVSNLGQYDVTDARTAQFIPREKEDIIPIADVAAEAILAPGAGVLLNTSVIPSVKVKNLSPAEVKNVTITFKIGSVYDKSKTVTLLSGEDIIAFDAWTAAPLGIHAVEASVSYVGDHQPSNNIVTGQVRVLASLAGVWSEVKSMPKTPTDKAPKDGAWMALHAAGTDANPVIYVAKGNKATDFYMYDPLAGDSGTWYEKEEIPGNEGTKLKPPSKGCVGVSDGVQYVYMTKGNNTLGFWRYDAVANTWDSMPGVP
ncbi:MAG: hypothetical protein ABIL25_10035, partial [candidate division WOR-3 bacterium]